MFIITRLLNTNIFKNNSQPEVNVRDDDFVNLSWPREFNYHITYKRNINK